MRFIPPAALRAMDERAVDALLEREECVVAAGEGDVRGRAALALLRADYAVLTRDAVIHLDSDAAVAAAEARGARPSRADLPAPAALAAALCDEVIDVDPQEWFARWIGGRSEAALDAAAMLIRGEGGDAKEREVFAALFARGVPQAGLRAFLSRKA